MDSIFEEWNEGPNGKGAMESIGTLGDLNYVGNDTMNAASLSVNQVVRARSVLRDSSRSTTRRKIRMRCFLFSVSPFLQRERHPRERRSSPSRSTLYVSRVAGFIR